MWNVEANDRYLDDISTIKFNNNVADAVTAWSVPKERSKAKQTDIFCVQKLEMGDFILRQVSLLEKKIIKQRSLYFTSLEMQKKKFDRGLGKVENQGLVVFMKYENLRFQQKFDDGNERKVVLSEDWLLTQIYSNQSTRVEDALEYIGLLECHKMKSVFQNLGTSESKKHGNWSVLYDDQMIAGVSAFKTNEQRQAFSFYLALLYDGIFSISSSPHTHKDSLQQHWILSQKMTFSINFVECLFVADSEATYVLGSILPCQVPKVKSQDGQCELQGFSYKQYFMLHGLKVRRTFQFVTQVKSGVPDKKKQEPPTEEAKNTKCGVVSQPTYVDERLNLDKSEFKDPTVLPAYTGSALFNKQSIICDIPTLAQDRYTAAITAYRMSSNRLNTLRCDNSKLGNLKVVSQDISEYTFDPKTHHYCTKNSKEILRVFDPSTYAADTSRSFQSDKKYVEALGHEKNSGNMLKILESIPTLDLQLSNLQKAVVTSSKELLCLGRSGTGKTTCSILRLFSQELMFITLKKHAKLQWLEKQDGVARKILLEASDLEQPCNMKTVFISASPVLVNEVQRYYFKLKESLVKHLKAREQARQDGESTHKGDISSQYSDLIKIAQFEADELQQEMASKQQLDMPNAFEDLKPKHFPLFATVKQLLYMMDASLTNSFFCRDGKNNLIAMQSNLSWHNENKGMFMINQQYRDSTNYDDLLAKYSDELITDVEGEFAVPGAIEAEQEKTKADSQWGYCRYKTEVDQASRRWTYTNQQLSFEVDFEIFEQKFFSRFTAKHQNLNSSKLSSAMIWTEIFSVIKGGLLSSNYYKGFVDFKIYFQKLASPCLNKQERRTIYWIFLEYEKWKSEENAFDLMDLVHHISTSNKFRHANYYTEFRIDYLMIDEVQDLTPKTLQTLLGLTQNKAYFAGDTAQTIAKGVGARFSDLSSLFKELNTHVLQLTTNYRSHGQILALANSVVGLLETLFPFSIDKLKKETSKTTGMKPLVLMPLPEHTLRKVFLGQNFDNNSVHLTTAHSITKPQFGCNQVVIVRDQKQKETLPEFFENMLCLTVYEAKGLEFDDVVLYNFFNCGQDDQRNWKILNEIQFIDPCEEVQDSVRSIIDELESFEIVDEEQCDEKFERKMVQKSRMSLDNIYRKYALLCIDLKYLYVAITRPKKRLIIYDTDAGKRTPIQRIWETLDLVTVLNSTMIEQDRVPEEIQAIIQKGCMSEESSISSQQDWKIQGIKFFKKKQFDQARKCFRQAGEQSLINKCDAYQQADLGSELQSQADSIIFKTKFMYGKTKTQKGEKKQLFRQATKIRIEARKQFEKAGANFEICGLLSQAASCYFTAKNFKKAAHSFEQLGQFGQAGECLMQSRQSNSEAILHAAQMFERGNLITRAIECYERIGAWEQLLLLLHKYGKVSFKETDRQLLANKYIPIALNKLYMLLSHQETVNEENLGVQAELKIKQKYANVEKIDEEEYDEELSSEEEDKPAEQEEGDKPLAVQQDQQQPVQQPDGVLLQIDVGIQVPAPKVIVAREVGEEEIEIIDSDEENQDDATVQLFEQAMQLKKKKSSLIEEQKLRTQKSIEEEQLKQQQSQEESFEVLDASDRGNNSEIGSNEDKKEETQVRDYHSEFEHLSCYDPDDEFLQSSHSIILLQNILGNQDLDQTSEYSVIDDSDDVISLDSRQSLGSSRSIRFIKSQKQTEDTIVKKIIYYIGLFSSEVREMLDKVNKKVGGEIREEDIHLEKLTAEFVEVVLRILERYDLIKLCLILCNRFQLNSKLGQYVVSSCLKYQNLQYYRFTDKLEAFRKSDSIFLEKQKKSALVAHEAMHNVLGLISSKYLKLKDFNQPLTNENSLGIENYRLMFSLGFWKKLVYTLNGRMSLQLCLKFTDTANFMLLKERFGTSELISQWKTLVHFKQAMTIIDKCINRNKSSLYKDPFLRYTLTSSQLEDELAMNQLLEIPEVRDCHDLIKFLIMPDFKTTVVIKKQNNIVNNIYANRTVVNEDQVKVERITDRVTLEACEVVTKHFSKIAVSSEATLVQLLLAFVLMHRQGGSCKISNIIKDEAVVNQLIKIYVQASNCFSSNSQSMCQTALLASVNITGLDSDDYLTNEIIEEDQNLFLQYQGTHVLASVHSPITSEIQEMQRKLADKQFKEQFIIQGQEMTNQFDPEAQKTMLAKLGYQLKLNSRHLDIKNLPKLNQPCAMVVDMDLQFILVPQRWVKTQLTARISKQLQELNKELLKFQTSAMSKVQSWKEAALLQGQILSQQYAKNWHVGQLAKQHDLAMHQHLEVDYAKLIAGVDSQILQLIDDQLGGVILKQKAAKTITKQVVNTYSLGDINSNLFLFTKHQGSLTLRNSAYSSGNIMSATTFLDQVINIVNGYRNPNLFEDLGFLLQRAANLFAIAGRQESFIDLVGCLAHKCKDKDLRKLFSSLINSSRAQAHFKNGLITEGCFELLAQYKQVANLLRADQALEIIEYAFYTLMTSFGPVVLPEWAMSVLDSWYDLALEKEKANAQLGIVQSNDYDYGEEVYDDYYNEWDRPEISQVKQIQLKKRPSQKDEKYLPILTYKQEAYFVASKPNAISILKQILDIAIAEFKNINTESYSEELSNRWFNIMITTCVNIDVTQYKNQLKQLFQLLESSPLSDYYQELLLQYTSEPTQLRKMFTETEDEFKYTFFAKAPYLVKVTANVELKEQSPSKSFALDLWMCKRVQARRVIRKCLHQRVLDKGNDSLAKFKPLFMQYGIDLSVLDIQQSLPNMQQAIMVLKDLKNRQLAFQELLLLGNSQRIKSCFDIQVVIQKQVQVGVVFAALISCLNNFVKGKASILKSFADLGDVDVELVEGIEKAKLAGEIVDCETQIWYQCSQAKVEQLEKEDERVRASRMLVKWQSWNTLAQRKARITSRLQKYKDLA